MSMRSGSSTTSHHSSAIENSSTGSAMSITSTRGSSLFLMVFGLLFMAIQELSAQTAEHGLVALKFSKSFVLPSDFSHRHSKFRKDGKLIVMADRQKLAVWETKTGLPIIQLPPENAESYVNSVDFSLETDTVIACGPFARMTQAGSFGSRSNFWIGGSIRTWRVSATGFEFSRFVTEKGYSEMAVASTRNEVFAIRSDLYLCRFPIEPEPKLRTQADLEIAPDPKYDHHPGLANPFNTFVLSDDSNSAIILVSDQDKAPGILHYSIDRKSCRFISGNGITLACGKKLSRPNFSADSLNCATLSKDGKAILLAFHGDSDKIYVLDSDNLKHLRTFHLSDGCKITRLEMDSKGRIAAQLEGNNISVIDEHGNLILRDRKSSGERTIRTFRIVGDTLMLLIGGDKVEGELPPENQGDPRAFFVERISLKSPAKE